MTRFVSFYLISVVLLGLAFTKFDPTTFYNIALYGFAWIGLGFTLSLVLALTGVWDALGRIYPEREG